ncbi:GIY-YIG nuclease family protein [Candidatus Poriferisocius sp.]|uniref:GIY-YIG nuclease family protein n=1 Tax=Candidatus Poriferisocius sp. TaxID=3101276 RepID=UPI003B02BD12
MSEDRSAASDDPPTFAGYVYVAVNPAFPEYVKIGKTTKGDPQTRISNLFTTSVPVPFELLYAAALKDPGDLAKVETALHRAFAPSRVHPRREFFEIEPKQAIAVLRLIDADVTDRAKQEVESDVLEDDRVAVARVQRRPTLNFSELGLMPDSVLIFDRDETVKIQVLDERFVELIDLPPDAYPNIALDHGPTHLSPLTRELLGLERNVAPSRYWNVLDGRSLLDLYEEVHGPR